MSDEPSYTPPKVWAWNRENGGRFANINRPISGATHDKQLPVGHHPLQLYSLGTPNGVKVTQMLEELLSLGYSGAEYDAWLIRIGDGDQFGSGFVAVNPNSKIPALVDRSGPTPIRVFESGAILMHLAEKFGAFLPAEGRQARRVPVMAVLADGQRAVSGGGFGHFYAYAPTKIEYAIDRFAMETSASSMCWTVASRTTSISRVTTIRSLILLSGPGMVDWRRAGFTRRVRVFAG